MNRFKSRTEKILGVLGGMGPAVSAEFLARVIDYTGAGREQENLRVLIDHNPRIPDRTRAILGIGENPLPGIKRSLQVLEAAGAALVAVPCNTAHFWYREMSDSVSVPVLNMLEAVVERCLSIRDFPFRAGILATDGTIRTGLYQDAFAARKIETVNPSAKEQEVIMSLIMRLKAGEKAGAIGKEFLAMACNLVERGADLVVIGCTDISPALKENEPGFTLVDSLSVLAEKSVDLLGGRK